MKDDIFVEQKIRLFEDRHKFVWFPEYYSYVNGNYYVNNAGAKLEKTLFNRDDVDFVSEFPDSLDLKITNKCKWGCSYCHESSIASGKSMNLEKTVQILNELPKVPIEIAIGGGNVLECPDTVPLLTWIVMNTPFLPRVTINQRDIIKYETSSNDAYRKTFEDICYLVDGLGISVDNISTLKIKKKDNILRGSYPINIRRQPVIHVIAGIIPIEDLMQLVQKSPVLILGYKQFGRAKDTKLPDLTELENFVKLSININQNDSTIAFDNLAIEQLHLKEFLDKDVWNSLYMGDEGKHSMYIDAVEETFAKTSRSTKRMSWNDISILDFFNRQKDDTINF